MPHPLTAAAITAGVDVDGFLAEATPEAKLARVREHTVGPWLGASARPRVKVLVLDLAPGSPVGGVTD